MKTINWQYIYRLTQNFFLIGVSTLLLTSCGGGSDSKDPALTPTATTTNHTLYLPKEVETEKLSGDIDGIFATAGSSSLPPSTKSLPVGIAADGRMTRAAGAGIRDVAGFIAERPAFNGEINASEVLDSFESLINNDPSIPSLIGTGRQEFSALSAALAAYSVSLYTPIQPTTLANNLVQYLGVNTQNGIITNLPAASGSESFETEYTLIIGVIYFNQNEIVVSVAVVPTSLAGTYAHVTSGIISANNVGDVGATPSNGTDSFTAQGGGGMADFLFVIDNSGSMSQEQSAVSSAATAFENAITNSGLDYRIGIITTDSATLRDGYTDGGFTADIAEFSADVVVGTSGSATESGIWFSEQSLQSTIFGDAIDGTVTTDGYPRTGASLSVIIMSDERSQYTSRSGGVAFDTLNNLFIDRGYHVYAMIEPNDSNSQYSPLALATGGTVADIGDITVFPTIMNNIAISAGGASSQFILTEAPIDATINVSVNGSAVSRDGVNGWTYNIANNSVVFHGTALLTGGETVKVDYEYFTTTTGDV